MYILGIKVEKSLQKAAICWQNRYLTIGQEIEFLDWL